MEREWAYVQLMVISSPAGMSLAAAMLTWRLSVMKRVYALQGVSESLPRSQGLERRLTWVYKRG